MAIGSLADGAGATFAGKPKRRGVVSCHCWPCNVRVAVADRPCRVTTSLNHTLPPRPSRVAAVRAVTCGIALFAVLALASSCAAVIPAPLSGNMLQCRYLLRLRAFGPPQAKAVLLPGDDVLRPILLSSTPATPWVNTMALDPSRRLVTISWRACDVGRPFRRCARCQMCYANMFALTHLPNAGRVPEGRPAMTEIVRCSPHTPKIATRTTWPGNSSERDLYTDHGVA